MYKKLLVWFVAHFVMFHVSLLENNILDDIKGHISICCGEIVFFHVFSSEGLQFQPRAPVVYVNQSPLASGPHMCCICTAERCSAL